VNPDVTADWNHRVRQHVASLDVAALSGLDRQFSGEIPPLPAQPGSKHLLSKTPVLQASMSMTLGFHAAWAALPALRDAALGPQRIWFSPHAVESPWNENAFHTFHLRSKQLGSPPMVIHRPEALTKPKPITAAEAAILSPTIASAPAATRIDVTLLDYHPNTLAFRVECPSDGWLVATDRWAPGWTATVNGRPATVYGGMFIFRAVQVQAGTNEIRFRYCPWGYPWLLLLSYATLGTVLAGSCWKQYQSGWKLPAACAATCLLAYLAALPYINGQPSADAVPLAVFDRTTAFRDVRVTGDADGEVCDGRLLVHSHGNDPQMLLPEPPGAPFGAISVKVRLAVPSPTTLQVFYLPAGATLFSEANSRLVALRAGENFEVIHIPACGLHGPLRVDPAECPGEIVIRSIEVCSDDPSVRSRAAQQREASAPR
jgi:hypothetical protein